MHVKNLLFLCCYEQQLLKLTFLKKMWTNKHMNFSRFKKRSSFRVGNVLPMK